MAYTETEEVSVVFLLLLIYQLTSVQKTNPETGNYRMHAQSKTYAENNKSDAKVDIETASQV